MRSLTVSLLTLLLFASVAQAQTDQIDAWRRAFAPRVDHDPWRIDWHATADPSETTQAWSSLPSVSLASRALAGQEGQAEAEAQAQGLHAAAIEHSDAYRKRAKIHKYASFATLPLFAAEFALGESLYDSSASSDSRRGTHAALGIGIVSLFGVNTVTGAWNMWGEEGRREKDGRTLRLLHGVLMMAANAGFVATAVTAPDSENRGDASTFESDKSLHRSLAITSIGIGTVGYLIMIVGNH